MSGINTSDMTSCPMHYFQRQTHIHQCNASKRPQSEKRDAIIFTQTYTVKKKKKDYWSMLKNFTVFPCNYL